MNRRNLITAAAFLSVPAQGATIKNAIFELRYFRMRNGAQIQRTSDFLSKHYIPAAQRAGNQANPHPATPAEIEQLLRSVW